MPLTADSILQENTGYATLPNGGTVNVSLPGGTTAGSTVIVFMLNSTGAVPSTPSGWVADRNAVSASFMVFRQPSVTAGETTWAFTFAGGIDYPVPWYAVEVTGLDTDAPFGVWQERATELGTPTAWLAVSPGATSMPTGTTGTALGTDLLVFSMWAEAVDAGFSLGSWGSFSNNLAVGGAASGSVAAGGSFGITATHRLSGGANAGPFSDTATYTQPNASSTGNAVKAGIFTFRAADSPLGFPLSWLAGFEQGSASGIGSATTIGKALWTTATGTAGTDIVIQASSARPGGSGYGCRIVQSAAAKSLLAAGASGGVLGGPYLTAVLGFGVKVVSSTGLVVLASLESTSTSALPSVQLVYDTATSRLGVRVGTSGTPGTPVYQSGTTAAGTWVWVDLRARLVGVTNIVAHADWSLDGVAQSSPADATTSGSSNWWSLRFGSTTTQTVTFDVDDVVFSPQSPAYPLGQHTIRALTVDPAGTPTINGTVGNFALVTANATGANLTAGTLTTARNNIDERPPTISTASDGVVQQSTAATDYLQFPMADLTLGPNIVAAVKALAVLISTTGAGAGTLSIKGWDGVTEHNTITPTAAMTPGSSTTVSATVPPYATGMWPNTWTPAKLTAAALRVGYSDDATPDMGVHAIYLEVATRPAITGRQLSVEDDTFTVDLILSPYSSASVSYNLTSAHPSRGATFSYSALGVPQTPVYVAPASSATVTVNADSFGDISDVSLAPDPAV
jgi:hypothetical protein